MDETAHDRILKLHGDLKKKGETIIDLRNQLKLARAEADGLGSVMLEMQEAAIKEKLRADKAEHDLTVVRGQLEIVSKMRDGYQEQWKAVKARLDDWQDTHNQIMAEQCAGDEKHCTCVPSLRVEIKRLNAEVDELQDEIEKLNDELSSLDDENDELRCRISELED